MSEQSKAAADRGQQNNHKGGQEQDLNQLLKIRRDKLAELQQAEDALCPSG